MTSWRLPFSDFDLPGLIRGCAMSSYIMCVAQVACAQEGPIPPSLNFNLREHYLAGVTLGSAGGKQFRMSPRILSQGHPTEGLPLWQ